MLRYLAPFMDDLWRNRELLWQFTLRNVELRHKGSHLGLVWSFLNPLLMLAMYVLVFGYIFGGSFGVIANETKVDFGLGIFIGLTLFHFVAEVLTGAPGVIVSNPNFVKKVVFPLEILPAATVLSATFHMLISLGLVVAGILLLGPGLTIHAIWLPVILLPVILLMLGVCWFVSALGVFLRDIGQFMQFAAMALMFASAVFYSAQRIPPDAWYWMRFNPVLLSIELARDTALWARPINVVHLTYVYATGLGVCYLGSVTFKKTKAAFADVL
jgi:lipopolysaccharide transport system permease protein